MTTLRVLTPGAPKPQPMPRWPWVMLGVAALLAAFGARDAGAVLGLLSSCALGYWLEERAFIRFSQRALVVRSLFLWGQSLVWLPAMFIAGAVALVPLIRGPLELAIICGAGWFSSASLGSFTTLAIDRALSATPTRFRTRLTLAIFILMVLALVAGLLAGALAFEVLDQLFSGTLKMNGSVDLGSSKVSPDEVLAYLRAHPSSVLLGSFGLAVCIGVPSWLSAAGKLADAAMERLRPLTQALDEVGQGARDIRVEEAGSLDFIDLNRRFNKMVVALASAERMEDAFGRYVSKKIITRIRDQHGEAVIPAQLRTATVFFADVRGYTALSEKLSPEAVVALLNRYLAHVVSLVEQHEGYLNKFIGDAVVVVFNGPVEQLDHATRAVQCAAALQSMVAEQNKAGAFAEVGELRIGIGVATGPMVCGNVGGPSQMEYTVIGDTVNLSARLTSAAAAGEIWVSDATAEASPSSRFEPLPEMKVKGKEKPVTPRRLVF